MTPEIILYHYDFSPYAEKIRAALRIKGLAWSSCKVSHMPDGRPFMAPITHGYRRIPVLQIGNDVYCDTQAILDELERRYPIPTLYPPRRGSSKPDYALYDITSQWVQSTLFKASWTQMPWDPTPEEVKRSPLAATFGDEAFVNDRNGISGVTPAKLRQMKPLLQDGFISALDTLEAQLRPLQQEKEYGFFLETSTPSMVDINIYWNLWFVVVTNAVPELLNTDTYPGILTWFKRIQLYIKNHKHRELDAVPITPEQALQAARQATATGQTTTVKADYNIHLVHPAERLKVGDWVSVSPNDYMKVPVQGRIVGLSTRQIAVQPRPLAEVPDVQVTIHFPRFGYVTKPIAPGTNALQKASL
ncbi:hypothetical protein BGW42_004121 [Actinomortierella wolfii]|nr:hypothetical protein BGW42_004121 [Actinomortierella wolfii]